MTTTTQTAVFFVFARRDDYLGVFASFEEADTYRKAEAPMTGYIVAAAGIAGVGFSGNVLEEAKIFKSVEEYRKYDFNEELSWDICPAEPGQRFYCDLGDVVTSYVKDGRYRFWNRRLEEWDDRLL